MAPPTSNRATYKGHPWQILFATLGMVASVFLGPRWWVALLIVVSQGWTYLLDRLSVEQDGYIEMLRAHVQQGRTWGG